MFGPGPASPNGSGTEENTTPETIIDLDEQDVPLAGPENAAPGTVGEQAQQLKKNTWTAIGISIAGIAALIAAAVALISRRKKTDK